MAHSSSRILAIREAKHLQLGISTASLAHDSHKADGGSSNPGKAGLGQCHDGSQCRVVTFLWHGLNNSRTNTGPASLGSKFH